DKFLTWLLVFISLIYCLLSGSVVHHLMPHIAARRIISVQLLHKVPRISTAKLSTFQRFTK
ncbi:hypothetical protein, partial [uncultured Duncaniella sp.]|uniref:hypothetical protein n=1 Tax=uncultured Duncaniella sp. TaxID=2768039 RepID=UPI00260B72E3